jgi:hypothetical protein
MPGQSDRRAHDASEAGRARRRRSHLPDRLPSGAGPARSVSPQTRATISLTPSWSGAGNSRTRGHRPALASRGPPGSGVLARGAHDVVGRIHQPVEVGSVLSVHAFGCGNKYLPRGISGAATSCRRDSRPIGSSLHRPRRLRWQRPGRGCGAGMDARLGSSSSVPLKARKHSSTPVVERRHRSSSVAHISHGRDSVSA